MPAGLGTLFAGLLLIVLAFVEGSSVWKALHEVLFGLFGCGSFVLGAAICYLAILYTRGEDLIGQMFKLMLGLVFASGTVIVFSEIPADIPAARMVAECYQNGVHAWLGGGAIGALLGETSRQQHDRQLFREYINFMTESEHNNELLFREVIQLQTEKGANHEKE